MSHRRICLRAGLVAALLFAASAVRAEKDQLPPGAKAILWTAPPEVLSAEDWKWGAGGREHIPQPPFAFVREDKSGSSPKVDVRDATGAEWTVKFGPEVHSDTFVPRLIHACGYFAVPTHFVPEGKISGVGKLDRARSFIRSDGSFRDARFKLHEKAAIEKQEDLNWTWPRNPFVGTHELNGLKILVMLTSNWDGKDATNVGGGNTAVFLRKADSAYIYAITDWGASMGKWGLGRRSKWDVEGFTKQSDQLIEGVKTNGEIDWGYSGKHNELISSGIRAEDVRWLLPCLTKATDDRLTAGLLAAGATREEAVVFRAALRRRIMRLQEVAGAAPIPQAAASAAPPVFLDFDQRLQLYLQLTRALQAGLPSQKTTDKATEIFAREDTLGEAIRNARATAKRGDIFTPEITVLFQEAIRQTFRGSGAGKVKTTVRQGEPAAGFQPVVNAIRPRPLPLTTVPPTLLQALPRLPKELAYGLAGDALILEDTRARLVVDLIPGAIPQE